MQTLAEMQGFVDTASEQTRRLECKLAAESRSLLSLEAQEHRGIEEQIRAARQYEG